MDNKNLLSIKIIEPDFKKADESLLKQIRLIEKNKKFRVYSSVNKCKEIVYTEYNPVNTMFDLMEKPYSYENHLKYHNAYMDLISEREDYHDVIKIQYKIKLIGYPIYSSWCDNIQDAIQNGYNRLNLWRHEKLQKRNNRIIDEIRNNGYIFTLISIFDSKAWCVAPKLDYPAAVYDSENELSAGCNRSCVSVCNRDAIVVDDTDLPGRGIIGVTINHNKCNDCGDCSLACPNENIVSHKTIKHKKIILSQMQHKR
ncbi:MAG: hypothetical protein JW974_03865 [Alphaproteobacteria bacterium]|nr:hypothetical protein [Alphaproteobacteria bacterium]